ncbi:MAG: YdcF family protein [Clostridia bacterium]|nr:YdcF family protein [Clostridia bacterium]
MKKKISLKKKLFFLTIVAMVIFVVAETLIYNLGSDYEMGISGEYKEVAQEDISATIGGNKEALKVESVEKDGDNLILIHVKGLGPGEANVNFRIKGDHADEFVQRSYHFTVRDSGLVVCNYPSGNFAGYQYLVLLLTLYLILFALTMLLHLAQYIKNGKFSYVLIAYMGIFFFVAYHAVFMLYEASNMIADPYGFRVFDILVNWTNLVPMFVIITLPLVVILAIALVISNIQLIRKEGFRIPNALGIVLAVLIFLGVGIAYALMLPDNRTTYTISMIMYAMIFYFEFMLASTIIMALVASVYRPIKKQDYVIILGCAIRGDGTPTPLLKGRVDAALKLYHRQLERYGEGIKFVPSGGKGSDEVESEARSMRDYLISQGIKESDIILEDKSTTTSENMKFSHQLIEEDWKARGMEGEPNIAFATTRYHVVRAYVLANKDGYEPVGVGGKTKWYFWPNAFVREFIGLVYMRWIRNGVFVACFTSLYIYLKLYIESM